MPEKILIQLVLIKYAMFKYVIFNVNSSEYLFNITNNYNEEGVTKVSVIVALFVIRKYMCVYFRYSKRFLFQSM